MAAGCSEDNNTEKPKQNFAYYSGTFYVTYVTVETNCPVDIPPNGPSPITIKGDEITFGSMKGPWVASEKRGHGRGTIGNDCPNHNPPTHCATCITMSFDIPFASDDSFSGNFGTGFTYADCSDDSCHTHYTATGKRM